MQADESQLFACPRCKFKLDQLDLSCGICGNTYPRVDGIPVLIDERNSVFRIDDYLQPAMAYRGASSYTGHLDARKGLRQLYRRTIYRITESTPPKRDFGVLEALRYIDKDCRNARILVIGAGDSTIEGRVTYTDVAFGKNVSCIADVHDLPFPSSTFDACIACAVLEHVADPYRCVDEIKRVLTSDGFVFAETPFMQPVHMGAHDFTRFTYLGHRRLFRYFDEVRSGIVGGPGVSAAQLLRYMIAAVLTGRALRSGCGSWVCLSLIPFVGSIISPIQI